VTGWCFRSLPFFYWYRVLYIKIVRLPVGPNLKQLSTSFCFFGYVYLVRRLPVACMRVAHGTSHDFPSDQAVHSHYFALNSLCDVEKGTKLAN
jgi:hypothetical protein